MKQKPTKFKAISVKNRELNRKSVTKCLKMSETGKNSITKNGIHQQQENQEHQQNPQINLQHRSNSINDRHGKALVASNNDNLVSCNINKSLEGGRLQFYKGMWLEKKLMNQFILYLHFVCKFSAPKCPPQ